MVELTVNTKELDRLAKHQTNASEKLEDAAKAAAKLGLSTWITHGPICFHINMAAVKAEPARLAAGEALKKVSAKLAEHVLEAKKRYASTDAQGQEQLDKQMGDR